MSTTIRLAIKRRERRRLRSTKRKIKRELRDLLKPRTDWPEPAIKEDVSATWSHSFERHPFAADDDADQAR